MSDNIRQVLTVAPAVLFLALELLMRSKKVEFRMPWPLYDLARAACKSDGFRSMARFFIGASLYYILLRRRLNFVIKIANADPDEQDTLISLFNLSDEEIIAAVVGQDSKRPSIARAKLHATRVINMN